jgi:hypothetical protein
METKSKRITKDEWWDICYALEAHIEQMTEWVKNQPNFGDTKNSLERNKELLTRLVNTKLSERDKYSSFPDWVEW